MNAKLTGVTLVLSKDFGWYGWLWYDDVCHRMRELTTKDIDGFLDLIIRHVLVPSKARGYPIFPNDNHVSLEFDVRHP